MSEKIFKTIDEQIGILRERGLRIDDEAEAKDFLLHNNYYRISGYSLTLRKNDIFSKRASFQNIVDIYNFDHELRHIILKFCTFANKDELPTKYEFTPFVGFMFVDEKYRGNRLSEKLIESACDLAKKLGYTKMYIMSGEIGLYEKYGFVKIGDYRTIYESVDQLFYRNIL